MTKFASAILLATLGATAAQAQVSSQTMAAPHEVVRYADLNLATPSGVAALDRRITAAAGRLCGPRVAGESLIDRSQRVACIRDTRASAEPQRSAVIASARRGSDAVQLALVVR